MHSLNALCFVGEIFQKSSTASVQTTDKSSEPVWVGSLNEPVYSVYDDKEKVTCFPRFCSISDKDVAIAADTFNFTDPVNQASSMKYLGMEFSGYDDRGQRVMGIVPYGVSVSENIILGIDTF